MIPEEKVNVVREYLKHEFPDHDIPDYFDTNIMGQSFYIVGENKKVSVRRVFLEERTIPQISAFLKISELGKQLYEAGITHIIVENNGSITPLKDKEIRSSRQPT